MTLARARLVAACICLSVITALTVLLVVHTVGVTT